MKWWKEMKWWKDLSDPIRAIIFAGAAIIITTIIFSGFFIVVPQAAGGIYVINKYTGSVTFCVANTSKDAPLR